MVQELKFVQQGGEEHQLYKQVVIFGHLFPKIKEGGEDFANGMN